tara:strand:- start:4075 stop:4458 length:384 start_codon:yes stop_codon:yes gene_type:complete
MFKKECERGHKFMAKKSNNLVVLGKWAFLIGLALAIIAGVIPANTIPNLTLILVILGLIVGFLNIAKSDTVKLLVAIIALMAVGSFTISVIPAISGYLEAMLANIVVLAGAAGFVVAIKAIVETSKQ